MNLAIMIGALLLALEISSRLIRGFSFYVCKLGDRIKKKNEVKLDEFPVNDFIVHDTLITGGFYNVIEKKIYLEKAETNFDYATYVHESVHRDQNQKILRMTCFYKQDTPDGFKFILLPVSLLESFCNVIIETITYLETMRRLRVQRVLNRHILAEHSISLASYYLKFFEYSVYAGITYYWFSMI